MMIHYTVHNRWDSKKKAFCDKTMMLLDGDAHDFKREIEKHYQNTMVTGYIESLGITINYIGEE